MKRIVIACFVLLLLAVAAVAGLRFFLQAKLTAELDRELAKLEGETVTRGDVTLAWNLRKLTVEELRSEDEEGGVTTVASLDLMSTPQALLEAGGGDGTEPVRVTEISWSDATFAHEDDVFRVRQGRVDLSQATRLGELARQETRQPVHVDMTLEDIDLESAGDVLHFDRAELVADLKGDLVVEVERFEMTADWATLSLDGFFSRDVSVSEDPPILVDVELKVELEPRKVLGRAASTDDYSFDRLNLDFALDFELGEEMSSVVDEAELQLSIDELSAALPAEARVGWLAEFPLVNGELRLQQLELDLGWEDELLRLRELHVETRDGTITANQDFALMGILPMPTTGSIEVRDATSWMLRFTEFLENELGQKFERRGAGLVMELDGLGGGGAGGLPPGFGSDLP
ncbi:MAG: hypothetical protein AAF533_27110 [Acidobacteriota bacterium]